MFILFFYQVPNFQMIFQSFSNSNCHQSAILEAFLFDFLHQQTNLKAMYVLNKIVRCAVPLSGLSLFDCIGPTDLSIKRPSTQYTKNQLNASEIATVKQLIAGYRESAAFLYRSAEELEQLLLHQNWEAPATSCFGASQVLKLRQPKSEISLHYTDGELLFFYNAEKIS